MASLHFTKKRILLIIIAGFILLAFGLSIVQQKNTENDQANFSAQGGGMSERGAMPESSAPEMALDSPEMAVDKGQDSAAAGDIAKERQPGTSDIFGLKVIQTASLTVKVKKGDFQDKTKQASLVASSLGGYVVQTQSFDDSYKEAIITMRIPSDKFEDGLEKLDRMGKVQSREITGQDVTEEYVDIKSRLRHMKAVEARLLTLLARAQTVSDTLVVQDRLDSIQQQMEMEKGRLNYLDKMTQMSTITLTLSTSSHSDEPKSPGLWDSFEKAGKAFTDTLGGAIEVAGSLLAIALVILVIFAAVYAPWKILRKKQP